MNDLTSLQFFAALPLIFFGVATGGAVAWLIIRIRRVIRRDRGIF